MLYQTNKYLRLSTREALKEASTDLRQDYPGHHVLISHDKVEVIGSTKIAYRDHFEVTQVFGTFGFDAYVVIEGILKCLGNTGDGYFIVSPNAYKDEDYFTFCRVDNTSPAVPLYYPPKYNALSFEEAVKSALRDLWHDYSRLHVFITHDADKFHQLRVKHFVFRGHFEVKRLLKTRRYDIFVIEEGIVLYNGRMEQDVLATTAAIRFPSNDGTYFTFRRADNQPSKIEYFMVEKYALLQYQNAIDMATQDLQHDYPQHTIHIFDVLPSQIPDSTDVALRSRVTAQGKGFDVLVLRDATGWNPQVAESNHILSSLPSPTTISFTGSNWMSLLRDFQSLADITIPGTHDSRALTTDINLAVRTMAACQQDEIPALLSRGIRLLDLRCALVNGKLEMRHDIIKLKGTLDDVIGDIAQFLSANPTETVLTSIKSEQGESQEFAQAIEKVVRSIGQWYTGTTIPLMQECRGKMVLFRRYNFASWGLVVESWKDNNPHFQSRSGNIIVQDAYAWGTTEILNSPIRTEAQCFDGKWAAIDAVLVEAQTSSNLLLNFISAEAHILPLITPYGFAEEMNRRLADFLKSDAMTRGTVVKLGVLIMDFPTAVEGGSDLIEKIIGTNFGLNSPIGGPGPGSTCNCTDIISILNSVVGCCVMCFGRGA